MLRILSKDRVSLHGLCGWLEGARRAAGTLFVLFCVSSGVLGNAAGINADMILASNYDGINSSGSGRYDGGSTAHTYSFGVGFTLGGAGVYNATALTAPLSTIGSNVDPSKFSIYLRSDSGGAPGLIIGSLTLDSNVHASKANLTFSFNSPAQVVGGQTYWLTHEQNTTLPNTIVSYGIVWWTQSSGTGPTAKRNNFKGDGGIPTGPWATDVEQALAFQLEGTAVPEPSSFMLLSMTLAAGFFSWRMSRRRNDRAAAVGHIAN